MPARLAALSIATWKRGWSTILLDRRPSLAMTWAGMSRHQMTVSVAIRQAAPPPTTRSACDRGRELAEAGVAVLEREAEPLGRAPRHRQQVRVVGLGEVDDPPVVAEVHRLELRVAVDAEAADHEPLEVAGEEVGQPERRRLLVGQSGEGRAAGEELVAVGARQPLDALLGEHRVEQAARAAVGVGDEDPLVAVAPALRGSAPGRAPGCLPGRLWSSGGRQATSTFGSGRGQRDELARERAAADDEGASRVPVLAWSAWRTNGRPAPSDPRPNRWLPPSFGPSARTM